MFTGFTRPKANFYRLPNDWFDLWRELRLQSGRSRILGPLKVTEFVIQATWGEQNFGAPTPLSLHDFEYGRRSGRQRLDAGTGLSRTAIRTALAQAVDWQLLEQAAPDGRTHTYLPKMAAPEDTDTDTQEEDSLPADFSGFADPQADFFMVPKQWQALCTTVNSEVLLLLMEYLFRHTWGWQGNTGLCWLTDDDIAAGRQYRMGERAGQRYDQGIGYSARALAPALTEAVARGWLVWRYTTANRREYALRLATIPATQIAPDGEWLPTAEVVSPPPSSPRLISPAAPAPAPTIPPATAELQTLRDQVARLTQLVELLLSVLRGAGVHLPPFPEVITPTLEVSNPIVEEVDPILEASDPWLTEVSNPIVEEVDPTLEASDPSAEEVDPILEANDPPCNKTLNRHSKDTPEKTTTTNTAAATCAQAAPEVVVAAPLERNLPEALETLLKTQLNFYGASPRRELLAAYRQDPARIAGWIEHLAATRPHDPKVAGFLLSIVVRGRASLPVPPTPARQTTGPCPYCQDTQVVQLDVPVTDPDYGKDFPCPYCAGTE